MFEQRSYASLDLGEHRAMRVDAQAIAAADPQLVEHGFHLLQLERMTRCQLTPEASFVPVSMMLIETTRLTE
jgi:hypothetical protein